MIVVECTKWHVGQFGKPSVEIARAPKYFFQITENNASKNHALFFHMPGKEKSLYSIPFDTFRPVIYDKIKDIFTPRAFCHFPFLVEGTYVRKDNEWVFQCWNLEIQEVVWTVKFTGLCNCINGSPSGRLVCSYEGLF